MDKKLILKDMSRLGKSILHKYQDEFKVSYVNNIFAADISEFTTKGDKIIIIKLILIIIYIATKNFADRITYITLMEF